MSASNPSSHQQQAPSLLHGGQIIQGGSFVQSNTYNQNPVPVHVCSEAKDGFQHLQTHIATAAYDSRDQVDAPKCHPKTRIAVLDTIIAWILMQTATRAEWILWLNGAAGAGKSAIARSIVERCLQLNVAIARFFFFRADPTRNCIDSVAATLAHQLIKSLPELRLPIVTRIQEDPLIFTQSLESQLQHLIFTPLCWLQERSPSQKPVLLLFDGLDELSGDHTQADLIRIVASFIATNSVPLIVFFGSRAENQLKQAFSSRNVAPRLLHLSLDNNYMPDDDIRLFLNDSFAAITETHPYRQLLPGDWPPPALVEELVAKSSGQFIYASVVVKFVSAANTHPGEQLDIVRGLIPAGGSAPFAQLDALYRHIFSHVEDLQGVMYILAMVILTNTSRMYYLEVMFPHYISKASLPLLLANLTSLITCDNSSVNILHASLQDFLLSKTRSLELYIDREFWSTQLAMEFTQIPRHLSRFIEQYTALLNHAQPTESLRQRLATLYPIYSSDHHSFDWNPYLSAIEDLDFADDGEVYRLQHTNAIEEYFKCYPEEVHEEEEAVEYEHRKSYLELHGEDEEDDASENTEEDEIWEESEPVEEPAAQQLRAQILQKPKAWIKSLLAPRTLDF